MFDGEKCLANCLHALHHSELAPIECIVVNDGSSDRSAAIATELGCAVLSTGLRRGPAYARNLGARAAAGDILVFLDADVCLHADSLELLRRHFESDPQLAAAFGSYDSSPQHVAFVSQFRNLLHCFTHQTGDPDARTFWSACGAIRREWFERVGGFRTDCARPATEDIDLGYRIKAQGGEIHLDPAILVTHQKSWSLLSMVQTDIFDRAAPWTRLILQSGTCPNDLTLRRRRMASAVLTCLAFCFLMLALAGLNRGASTALAAAALAASALLDLDFYRFLKSVRGFRFSVAAVPLYSLFHLCSGVGSVLGTALFLCALFRRTRETVASTDINVKDPGDLRAHL